jgi:hypothetical protein
MTITDSLQRLNKTKESLLEITEQIIKAYGGALYPLDFLAYATVNRTLHFIPAFTHSVETRNFFVAAPLLRMQLDSCLRFSAAWSVNDCQTYASKILSGVETRKLKDAKGNRLTDAFLVSTMSIDYPWVESVYQHCSGFVHLSRVHIVTMITEKTEQSSEENRFNLAFGFGTVVLEDEKYIEAVEGFIACVGVLLDLLKGWQFTKDNPQLVKQMGIARASAKKTTKS